MAADNSSSLTPLRHLDDEDGTGWLFDWFTRLFQRWDVSLDEVQAADLISALDLAEQSEIRNLGVFATLIQNQRLRGVLANYVAGGKWGHVFDGEAISLALIVVIILARMLGSLFRTFHQPPVIGEIIAGILLGPSVLGRLAPGVASAVLPSSVAPFLNVISQVGVILYMFLVGLELDPKLLRNRGHTTVAISHASILAPFLMGAALALFFYPRLSPSGVSFTSFSLFIAVSMSITAFAVLARILTDRGIHKTRMGVIALTCAAVDDVTAWCLLALVASVVQAHTSGALSTIALAFAFIAAMAIVARPVMVRLTLLHGNRGLTQGLTAAIFVALLLSALKRPMSSASTPSLGPSRWARSFLTTAVSRANLPIAWNIW